MTPKIFFCDLDYTLVNSNLQNEFIKYSLQNSSYRFHLIFNLIIHYLVLFKTKIFNSKKKYNLVYYRFSTNIISTMVSNWINGGNLNHLQLNNRILSSITDTDIFIIITNCPSFISIPVSKFFFRQKTNHIFSSKINISENHFHFTYKHHLVGKEKANIVKKVIKGRKIQTIGFGDSKSDKYFVDLCDSGHVGSFF